MSIEGSKIFDETTLILAIFQLDFMKFEYRSLICKITSVVCFGLFLFLLSKFVLQGFGSINHLAVFGLNQNLRGGVK